MPIPAHLSRLAGPTLRLQPDSRLVELVREGHERAFEEIVRRYRGPLTGFAGGIVPEHRAEDIVQESLTRALETMRADDRALALKAWLYTIVRNRALNSLRDEPVHEEISPQHDGVPQPPDIAARRAEVASLVVGIKGLPEQQRQAIVQRELEGFGHEQIAGSLGVTPGAVRQLIFRARANLREGFGALIPLPVVRQILDAAAVRSSGIEAVVASGGGAAAIKVAMTLLATGAAVGGGAVAVHQGRSGISDPIAPATADASTARHAHHRSSPATSGSSESASNPGSAPASTDKPHDAGSRPSQDKNEASGSQSSAGDAPSAGPISSGGGGDHSGGGSGPSHETGDDSGSNSGPGGGSGQDEGGSSDSGGESSEGHTGSGHSGSGHSGGTSGPGGGDDGPSSGPGGGDEPSGGDDGSGDDGDPVGDGDPAETGDPVSSGHGHGSGGSDDPEPEGDSSD